MIDIDVTVRIRIPGLDKSSPVNPVAFIERLLEETLAEANYTFVDLVVTEATTSNAEHSRDAILENDLRYRYLRQCAQTLDLAMDGTAHWRFDVSQVTRHRARSFEKALNLAIAEMRERAPDNPFFAL